VRLRGVAGDRSVREMLTKIACAAYSLRRKPMLNCNSLAWARYFCQYFDAQLAKNPQIPEALIVQVSGIEHPFP
jgi:hypothetical protein